MRGFLRCIPLLALAATPAALAQSTPGAGLVASAGPTTVVAKLYKDFAWEALGATDKAFGKPLAQQPRKALERYFDRTLASLLVNDDACIKRNRGADCNLGFTPIFASNDPEASDLDITPLSGDRVAVSFTYPGNGEKVGLEYLTVRTLNGWRIKDIVYHNMNDEHLARMLSRPFPADDSEPCKEIGPAEPKPDPYLDQHIAKSQNLPDAAVRQVFKSGSWEILYVTSSRTDGAYLFYAVPPEDASPVTLWAGAARADETAGIEHWVAQHAAGIPADLAKCFAVYVTTRRSM